MKVAFYSYHAFDVVNSPHTLAGGMELQVLLLGRELMSRGVAVEFLVGDSGQEDLLERDGLIFRKVFKARPASAASRTLFFLRAIRSCRADILMERGSSINSGSLFLVSKLFGMKYVFAAASDVNCDRHSQDPSCMGRFRRFLYDIAIRGAAVVVVQKQSQRDMLRTSYRRDGVIIRSLALVPKELPEKGNTVRKDAVWISNLHRYKQPELFLELARRLPGYRFAMAGGTRDAAYGRAIADSASRIPNLEFCGFLPQEQLWQLLSRARVLVNTTVVDGKYEEGFPNTFIQAWALGIPVVSLISNPDALITTMNVGRVSRTPEQMERDVVELFSADTEWEAMSARCRKLFSSEFVASSVVDAYMSVFRKCEQAI